MQLHGWWAVIADPGYINMLDDFDFAITVNSDDGDSSLHVAST